MATHGLHILNNITVAFFAQQIYELNFRMFRERILYYKTRRYGELMVNKSC